jgi:ABC-type multidrug transport system fused ATPase/permease subunit
MAQNRERQHIGKGFWRVSLISTARRNEELDTALRHIRRLVADVRDNYVLSPRERSEALTQIQTIIDEVLGDQEEEESDRQGTGQAQGRAAT